MKNKKVINSFKYAFEGIFSCFKTERNMKIHLSIMILVIIMGTYFKISVFEWVACVTCFALLMGGEMFNTSIETIVDMVMPNKNEKAKKAKDVAAGGVLIFAIFSAIVGLIIFLPKIIALFR